MKKSRKHILAITAFVLVATIATFFVLSKTQIKRSTRNPAIQEVDFDISMGKGLSEEYNYIFTNRDDTARYTLFRSLYDKNLPSKVTSNSTPKIPKIVHQIWLGPKLPPGYFSGFQRRLQALHPEWEYHLWTEAELAHIGLEMQDLVDQSPNYAEKADIIRCELLERFGGVYMDIDIECFQPLDDLHAKYDFYAGLEHPHEITTTQNRLWVGISIMASRPGHPIMKRWKELIRERWEKVNEQHPLEIPRIVNHTYFPFTCAVLEKIGEGNNVNIVLPTTYFYPLSPTFASKRRSEVRGVREKFYDLLEKLHLKKSRPYSKPLPESIAVHYWGNNWIPSEQVQLNDVQRQVEFLRKEMLAMQTHFRELQKEIASNKQLEKEAVATR